MSEGNDLKSVETGRKIRLWICVYNVFYEVCKHNHVSEWQDSTQKIIKFKHSETKDNSVTSGYAMVVHGRPKPLKIQVFLGVIQPPGVAQPLYSRGHNKTWTCNMCPSLIQIGSKTAEKNSAQTNRQTDRHYENNGHLAVNQHHTKSHYVERVTNYSAS